MIVVDVQAVQSVGHGERGIARYTRELARALASRHPDTVDVFAYDDRLPNVDRLKALGLGPKLRSFRELRGASVDVLHVNSPFERPTYAELAVPVRAESTVVTCYDLIPYLYSERYLRTPAALAWYRTRLMLLHAADAVVTDSRSAAADAIDVLGLDPAKVRSIGAGTSPDFRPPTTGLAERFDVLRRLLPNLLPGFVLVPAGPEWRKNIDGALYAYAQLSDALRARHQLVIASRLDGEHRDAFDRRCAELGISADVVVTGFVDDADLVRLYQSAEVVVFPSFYEGFGLPVLEARRCGARVICSNSSSMPEVLPDLAATFNPHVFDEIAATLHAALTDDATRRVLDAVPDPGFSWEASADAVAEVYVELMRSRTDAGQARSGRPVVGLVVPLAEPDARHADTVRDLARRLRQTVDVHLFTIEHDVAQQVNRHVGFDVPVSTIRTLPMRHGLREVDHVVYCTGDTVTDDAAARVAPLVPGVVLPLESAGDDGGVESVTIDDGRRVVHDAAIDVVASVAELGQALAIDLEAAS